LSWFYRIAYAQYYGWDYYPNLWQVFANAFSYNHWALEDMGYAVVDINNDGAPELVLLGRYHDQDDLIFAIYTLVDNEPVNVHILSRGGPQRLAADGTLHVMRPYRAGDSLSTYRLEPGASELTQLTFEEVDWRDVEWPTLMQFNFIPIEQ